jgi:mutator protein MutT
MPRSPILVANIFLWHKDSILLLKRSPAHTFGNRSLWNCPGGSIEFGEDAKAAITREVQEETGITPRVQRLVTMWADTFPTGVQIIVYSFVGEALNSHVKINEESVAYKWFSPRAALALDTFPNFKEGLLKSLALRKELK